MAVSNIHETLLMYTKQKSLLNRQLSDVMMDMVAATRQNAELQRQYNEKVQNAYYDDYNGYSEDPDAYIELMDVLENEHMFDLQNLESWESELELKKNSLETRLNEISSYEQSWTKLLQQNIKNDFSYGGGGQ
jgi:hypothetical protein